jgi:glycosyltransferase involved in cell wall biosynthesis
MKIAMVSEHANPLATVGGVDAGGQNVHVDALATGLVARGHDVTVFTRRDNPSAQLRVVSPTGYVVEQVPAGPPTEIPKDELLRHMPEFSDYLEARWTVHPHDVVHAHFWMSGLAGLAAARATGPPLTQTFHALGTVKRRYQGSKDTSPPNRISLESQLCEQVDRVIATCSDEVNELEAMGMRRDHASIVPCGVDLDLFRPAPPPPPSRRRPRLLVIGRLVERKGVAEVITALRQLPGVELLIAGGPSADSLEVDPEVQRLQRVAAAEGVSDRVRFLGSVDRPEMPALIHSCDVVVAVPWYEPFGIVPLEAMACGRPVVASAVGGLTDTVAPGRTGELVPPRDPDRLAQVLRELLADHRRRERYGAAGLARVRARYGWGSVCAATEQVYSAVVAGAATVAEEVHR